MNYQVRDLVSKYASSRTLTINHVITYQSLLQARNTDELEYTVANELRKVFATEIFEKTLHTNKISSVDTPNGREYKLTQVCMSYEELVELCTTMYNKGQLDNPINYEYIQSQTMANS